MSIHLSSGIRHVTFRLLLLVCLGFWSEVPKANASVFSLEGPSWNGWVPLDGLGWEKAYETEMIVNGKRTMLHLYCTRYTEPVLTQLESRLGAMGATLKFTATGDGFAGAAWSGNREVKVLVSTPKGEPRHMIFLTYPDPNGRTTLKDPIDLYPGSKTSSSVANIKTGTHYLSLKTSDTPTQVQLYYERLLEEGGWKRMTPSVFGRGEVNGMAIFEKKRKVCYIQVRQTKVLSSTITILVKKGTM